MRIKSGIVGWLGLWMGLGCSVPEANVLQDGRSIADPPAPSNGVEDDPEPPSNGLESPYAGDSCALTAIGFGHCSGADGVVGGHCEGVACRGGPGVLRGGNCFGTGCIAGRGGTVPQDAGRGGDCVGRACFSGLGSLQCGDCIGESCVTGGEDPMTCMAATALPSGCAGDGCGGAHFCIGAGCVAHNLCLGPGCSAAVALSHMAFVPREIAGDARTYVAACELGFKAYLELCAAEDHATIAIWSRLCGGEDWLTKLPHCVRD